MNCFSYAYAPMPTLLEQMAVTPRYRLNGLPHDIRHVIIFADRRNAVEACEAVAAHCPQVTIQGVCLHKGDTTCIRAQIHGKEMYLPILTPESIDKNPHCLVVLYWSDCIVPDLLYHLETAIKHTLSIAVFPRIPFGTGRRICAELYERYHTELEWFYAQLADDESKLSFAATLKGLLTGEIDWLRPPVCQEYQHPAASAMPGDIVLDAGLFDSTVLRRFSQSVGATGHVYGFEPEPENFAFVQHTLDLYGYPDNVTLVKKGLYSERGFMHISNEGASGMLLPQGGSNSSPCEVVDVDSFVQEYSLSRVDLIKMDIEGAEMSALHGATATIQRWKPKLQICAYHHINDIIDIPRLIHELVPEYCLYFTSHVPYQNEYICYASIPQNAGLSE